MKWLVVAVSLLVVSTGVWFFLWRESFEIIDVDSANDRVVVQARCRGWYSVSWELQNRRTGLALSSRPQSVPSGDVDCSMDLVRKESGGLEVFAVIGGWLTIIPLVGAHSDSLAFAIKNNTENVQSPLSLVNSGATHCWVAQLVGENDVVYDVFIRGDKVASQGSASPPQ